MTSSLHQFIPFWKGNEVKVVWVGKQPFIATSNFVEASYHDQEFGLIKFKGKKKDEAPRKIYIESSDTSEIQDQVAKLLMITNIVPFRQIKGSIIEEIEG